MLQKKRNCRSPFFSLHSSVRTVDKDLSRGCRHTEPIHPIPASSCQAASPSFPTSLGCRLILPTLGHLPPTLLSPTLLPPTAYSTGSYSTVKKGAEYLTSLSSMPCPVTPFTNSLLSQNPFPPLIKERCSQITHQALSSQTQMLFSRFHILTSRIDLP